MENLLRNVELAIPLFALVLVGYLLARFARWPEGTGKGLNAFVFSVALPALLFRQMSDLSQLPPVGPTLLLAFFGGCLVVFALGRLWSWRAFGHDGAEQTGDQDDRIHRMAGVANA